MSDRHSQVDADYAFAFIGLGLIVIVAGLIIAVVWVLL